MKIAVLSINTGVYEKLWDGFYESAKRNLLPYDEKTFFVWTDSENITNKNDVIRIQLEAEKWPYNTLFRYKYFLQKKEELKKFDYVFFFNANSYFKRCINREDVGIYSGKELVATKHIILTGAPENVIAESTERDENSNAYIPMFQYSYVWGALVGGKAKPFIDMCQTIDKWTDEDLNNDIIPIWHDESFLNKYRFVNRDRFYLIKRYVVFPEEMEATKFIMRCSRRIILRDKTKYFTSIKNSFVTCYGGFGNQLWQISNALKTTDDIILNIRGAEHITDFRKYFKNMKFTTSYVSQCQGAYISLESLVPKEKIKEYINEVDVKKYDTVIHIRLGDYLNNERYSKVILTQEYIKKAIKLLGKKVKDCVIVTDSPELVKEKTKIKVLEIDDDLETF